MSLRYLIGILCLCLGLAACGPELVPVPKPRAYPRVLYPEKNYQSFEENYCAFHFEFPTYARVEQDTLFFDERPANACWFDLFIEEFDARIHCSYYPFDGSEAFEKLREDAFKMVQKHNIKASYIDEFPIQKSESVQGFAFNIEGPAASPFQFYLSDNQQHFLRGALYFNTQARPDSLAPIFNFVKADIMNMINTFEWKE
ncbi:MAG: hypothetical protein AAGG75_04595 [Bacteroidota bacterium]